MLMNIVIGCAVIAGLAGLAVNHDIHSLAGISAMASTVLPNVTIIFLALTVRQLEKRS